jgi:Carboxypeptidase regulatory-like domain
MTHPRLSFFAAIACLLSAFGTHTMLAQDATSSLSGIVTDVFGKPRSNVDISVKNTATGQTVETQSDTTGHYTIANLPAGDYVVTASTDGFAAKESKVTITAGAASTLALTLLPASDQSLPNAPSSTKTEPSLEDLGFSKSEQQANPQEQALLDKRTHMLKIHQRMGLITTIPLVATVILGPGAGGKSEGTATRDLHVALGALTGDLYGITAWYAIRAPRIKGTPKRGPIRFHEAMAWIHGPGMILTPILGAMAFDQKNNGEKVHGIAKAHGPVAIVTAGAFGAALLSVSVKF